MEEWRIIEEFPNYYISNLGEVKNKNNKILKQNNNLYGYKRIGLYKDGEQYFRYIHRLVAFAFLTSADMSYVVNHKDEDKANNCVDNLEWISRCDNTNYGTRNQRVSEKLKGRQLTDEHKNNLRNSAKKRRVLNIDTGEIFNSLKEAGESVNLTYQAVAAVCRKTRPSAGGYRWSYYED